MKLSIAGLGALFFLSIPIATEAVSITERAGNPFRTASNNQETILNPTNVDPNTFGLLSRNDNKDLIFDAKVETQPLVIEKGAGGDDLIIITTMKNEVYGINTRTMTLAYPKVNLGIPANTSGTSDMDMWGHTPTWGISATPIIDINTKTLFVAAWVLKNNNENRYRDYKIFVLDPFTGKQKANPVTISGVSQEGNSCVFNDANAIRLDKKQYSFPKLRAGLALTESHGLILSFAADSEEFTGTKMADKGLPNPHRYNPHGFVIAYDTKGLLGEKGISKSPAIFCTTAFDSWGGGIWQAGGAPVIDGDTIYVATSNGTSSNTKSAKADIDLTESMIKLRYSPSNNGARPALNKVDFYKAFLDEKQPDASNCLWTDNTSEISCGRGHSDNNGGTKAATDWDFGPSGPMMIPGSNLLLQGTKDGIIYSLNKTDLGKHEPFTHLMSAPPLVASYFVGDIQQNWQRANQLNQSIPCPRPIDNQGNGDVDVGTANWFQPCDPSKNTPPDNKMHHIHSLALAQQDSSGGTVFVWGENSNLKAYKFSTSVNVTPILLAEGDEISSKFTKSPNGTLENTKSPGGMPGGLLMVSSAPPASNPDKSFSVDPNTAIIWAVYPLQGDANKHFADGQLIAYDATKFLAGKKLNRLYSTGIDNQEDLGIMTRMAPPVVANGKVYVLIYRVNNDNLIGSQLKIFGLKK